MTGDAKVNRQWVLANRPEAAVDEKTFELRTGAVPALQPGEALVRIEYLSVDPTQRSWLNDRAGYLPPVAVGEVMRAGGAGRVVESRNERFPVGQVVSGFTGWQDYLVIPADGTAGVRAVPDGIPPTAALGVLGSTGLAAYFGLLDIGRPQAGETVLVSGAAGATGSVAGQIARILGCRVIGVAGGPDKCAWVVGEAGFDACIDYRNEDVAQRLAELAPDGIDVFFDNVGGATLDAALGRLAMHARVVICGAVASGYAHERPAGPGNYVDLIQKRARMEGFLYFDYAERFPEAIGQLHTWVGEGRIKHTETVTDGFENAPDALRGLFEGRNNGKQLIRIA
ncbi:NADP-dependent oxidoreductase [Actinoplanes sp. RD1]|uniref:NADP-dependent oxidoreductase n=1 Tax=Actinoplanes sp. RD1 TaxID=3064538 RepID=UPI002741A38F|nr:NADP-dependent oxidoreductase [Actinoplanes sp. RD1]